MSKLFDYDARFRFRIWYKEFKRFLTGEEWYLDMDGNIRFAEYPQGNGDNAADSVFEPVKNRESFVIEPCTGAVDKNKKLIYEGDIVKVKRCFTRPFINDDIEIDYKFEEGDEEIGHIIWAVFSYKFLVSYEWMRHDDFDDFTGIDHRYEVIGNIHENPEIVKYSE